MIVGYTNGFHGEFLLRMRAWVSGFAYVIAVVFLADVFKDELEFAGDAAFCVHSANSQ